MKVENLTIIGSGGAGLSAALESKRLGVDPLVLTKTAKDISKTASAQGGLQASVLADDSPALHYDDTLKAGNFKANPKLVEILTNSAVDAVCWLESIGVEFDRADSGEFKVSMAGGISKPRVLSCGDSAGERILKPLLDSAISNDIRITEEAAVRPVSYTHLTLPTTPYV